MKEFTEVPATQLSISKRKLVYGVGINDANYLTSVKINGKTIKCPYYRVWINMIERCYSKVKHQRHPTYKECTVDANWLIFSNFKEWMKTQDWKNKDLDKDLLVYENKLYSKNTCIFISHTLNSVITDQKTKRGLYLPGVYLCLVTKKYKAQCSI